MPQRPIVVPAQRTETAVSLVGRDTELTLLRAVFARTMTRRVPHVVTVIGDAGIGKSRIVADFERSLVDAALYVHFRCMRNGVAATFGPLVQLTARLTDWRETDAQDVALRKLRAFVDRAGAVDPERVVAALAASCAIARPGQPLPVVAPQALPQEVSDAWSELLSAANVQPVVLVVEDAQWAEPVLLSTLGHLVMQAAAPLLVMCLARPTSVSTQAELGGLLNQTVLRLDPLTQSESEQLVRQLTPSQPLTSETLATVLRRAAGNPLYLEQAVRALSEGNELPHGDSTAFGPEMIRSRLTSLAPDRLQVLQEAAVAGWMFWNGHLGIGLSAPDVASALHELEQRGLVWQRAATVVQDNAEYAFRHELIREMAYAAMSPAQCGAAHAAFGRWLERTFPERIDARAAELAHHFAAACAASGDERLREEARRYSLRAAALAFQENALHKAETFGRHAISMSRSATERVETLESLGDLYQVGDGAWRAYVAALGELRVLEPAGPAAATRIAAKAALVATRWREHMHDVPRDEELEEVINVGLEAATSYDEDLVHLLVSKALLEASRPGVISLDGVACADEAVRIAQELNRPDLLSEALVAVARVRPDEYQVD